MTYSSHFCLVKTKGLHKTWPKSCSNILSSNKIVNFVECEEIALSSKLSGWKKIYS